ncbi:hypothetical protein GGQ74_000561 [Desulfobaculum xiamenense]|uniref:AB hydrolase-1 domain-containing protein n=1 Tax=Desulfobaculum xiamenense TaxID=995050 RepID=A0A846QF98_9BACT|nr:alpha/beta hydrolase [Desulfobaculum xiamenense]NJB66921.1 hypothetical protein [Desulfobaculum xiamenense]
MQLALSLLIAMLAYMAWVYVTQERMVYFPDAVMSGTPADVGLPFEDVALTASDGVRLSAWFVPHPRARGVVLFCHGNAGNMSHRLDTLRILNSLGLSVLIFDYRGYGQSGGYVTEEGTYRDARAAWQHLTIAREIPPQRIVAWGRSLGGGVAAWLAENECPAALVLESTFTSVPDMGVLVYRWLPVCMLARIHYDTEKRLRRVECPVLVMHSPQDEVIPFEQGHRLYGAAGEPRRFVELSGRHDDAHLRSGATYTRAVDSFLRELVGM